MKFKIITGITLLLLVVIFTLQNAMVVDVRFFLWTLSISRALLIFIVLSIGILMGWLIRVLFDAHMNDE
ncbi:LapA family protein [Rickettsiales bacterium]|nr:LapA family protein [Rickettsiales bacterium]